MARTHIAFLATFATASHALAADGKKIFADICQTCHQAGGKGAPGLAPPLVSKQIKALAKITPDYVPRVVLNGLSGPIEVDDVTYRLVMPPQADLSDSDIAAVSTYVLATLNGQKTIRFTERQIEAFRQEPKSASDLRALRKGPP